MSGLETLVMVASGVGTALNVLGTIQQGREQQARYKYEKKVASQQADEAQAASQREARQRYREGQLLESQQRAGIAAGGGSLSDTGVIDLLGNTRERTALAGQTEIYKGEQQARGYNDAAKVAGINAKNAMSGAYLSAGASLFQGVTSFYDRFGKPQKTAPSSGSTSPLYG